MSTSKRDRGTPRKTHRYWIAFSLMAVIHCVLTLVFTVWSLGWQMVVLDSGGKVAPFGLKVVMTIDLLLTLPLLLPLARLMLHLGFADPVNDPIYWPLPIINSFLVAYAATAIMRWYSAQRLTF